LARRFIGSMAFKPQAPRNGSVSDVIAKSNSFRSTKFAACRAHHASASLGA
jgi:hypothetical protein